MSYAKVVLTEAIENQLKENEEKFLRAFTRTESEEEIMALVQDHAKVFKKLTLQLRRLKE